nr:uncharacterized protein LOC105348151 [Crassostrea gigas]
MVIPQKLFENTIKWHQSKEFDDKRIFVRTHPFFAKWTEAEIEQLVPCLKKRIISAGQCAFLQGSDVTCLHFLVRGKARISAVPDLHRKQYPAMFDAAEMSKRHPIHFEHHMAKSLKLPSIPTSRNERFVASRRVQLCHVMEGEIIHDIEFLLNLHNSLFRVFCSTECEFYSLDTKQIDRFPLSRKSYVLKLLKTRTETRLSSRVSTIPGGKFDILPLLILQLRFVRILKENNEESARIHRLPLSECLHISGHVFKEYNPIKETAEKVETAHDVSQVPKYVLGGPDYYRKLVRKRQQEHEEIRRRYPDQIKECQSISNEMKSMILNNVKQRHLVEKVMKRYSIGWKTEESWMAR